MYTFSYTVANKCFCFHQHHGSFVTYDPMTVWLLKSIDMQFFSK